MKKFFLVPLIMTALVIPGFAEPEQKQKPHTEWIQAPEDSLFMEKILRDYSQGQYDSFLRQIDQSYAEASSKWQYNGVLEERKKLSALVQDVTSPQQDAFKKDLASLYEQENRELVDICVSEPNSVLTKDIKDMIFFTPSQHEKNSLEYVANLNWKFKGEGKTPIENKLIDIDTEFWLKSLSLDTLAIENKIDADMYAKQRTVLQLEKLKQMNLAAQEKDVDPQIKSYIKTAQNIYPKVHSSSTTRKYLHDLATGKIQPETPTQEKIKTIVVKYQEQQEQLVKKYFPKEQK